jgi:hypothetical protein
MVCTGIKKMADVKSKEEMWLNCNIQPFARQLFGSIPSVQLLQQKIGTSLSV